MSEPSLVANSQRFAANAELHKELNENNRKCSFLFAALSDD